MDPKWSPQLTLFNVSPFQASLTRKGASGGPQSQHGNFLRSKMGCAGVQNKEVQVLCLTRSFWGPVKPLKSVLALFWQFS